METVGIAVRLPDATWVNKNQEETTKDLAFGRKATHLLTRPDCVVLVDEVGSNTSQEGDGALGGEKNCCMRIRTKRDSSNKQKSFHSVRFYRSNRRANNVCCGS